MSRHSVNASMPGEVFNVDISVGEFVQAGQVVLRLEVMKMEIPVETPVGGRVVSLHVKAGDVIAEGQLLFVMDTP